MKKYIILIFSVTVLSITATAQSIKGSLNTPQVKKMDDGVLVYGVNDDKVFKMLLYDKELKLKKEFSKSLNKDVSKKSRYVQVKDGNFEFIFCNSIFCKSGSVLVVNEKLEEVSYKEYSKEEKNEFQKLIAPLADDVTKKQLGIRNSTDDDSYVTNLISGGHLWGPVAEMQREIYNTALEIPGSSEKVLIHRSYFDSIAHVRFAAGNYFEYKEKQKEYIMKGLAVFFMDDKNNILKIKKIDFPEYSFKESRGLDFKDKQEFVNYITKTKQGSYVLNCTNAARKYIGGGTPVRGSVIQGQTTQGWDYYATVGFSYLELDSGLNQVSSIFYPFEKIEDYYMATYGASANEGKTMVFSNAKVPEKPGPITSETLFFTGNSKPILKTNVTYEDTYFINPTRNAPIPNQFLMDGNTLILFMNKPGKDDYELKLIKL